MEFLIDIAKDYGLFVALVVYVIASSREREMRYLNVISTLSEDVKERLTKIEVKMWGDRPWTIIWKRII